jgi:hypothetical protein
MYLTSLRRLVRAARDRRYPVLEEVYADCV